MGTEAERRDVADLAADLATWLHGAPIDAVGPRARTLLAVAHDGLDTARWLCEDRPFLAADIGARTAVAWWPVLEAKSDRAPPAGEAAAQAADVERGIEAAQRWFPGLGNGDQRAAIEAAMLTEIGPWSTVLGRLAALGALADALGRGRARPARSGPEGGPEEVVGLTVTGELARALPAEIALLADPSTEPLVLHRASEGRLSAMHLEGSVPGQRRRKGPVIACVDTSASMEGAPERLAKALVLAVARRAVPQGRSLRLILFGGPRERVEISLHGGLVDLPGWLAFLSFGFRSGTDVDGPLRRAADLLRHPEGRDADILLVTDGLCGASTDVIADIRQAADGALWTVVCGDGDPSAVRSFSDAVFNVRGDGDAFALLDLL